MPIPTETYEAIFEQYSDAIQWMNTLGIKLSIGRTTHYERIIRYWKDTYRTASADDARNIFQDFVSSMFEIHDFLNIYRAFWNVPRDRLASIADKLQKGVNGPINATDETSKSTTARNFLFEATVAAKGHQPEEGVEAILDAKSDTGIRIDGMKIWVECKRISSTDRIENNVRKASTQLETILKRQVGTGHRGIVAIDISKVLNRGDKILVAATDRELLASVNRIMDQFISQYSAIWQRIYQRKHRKIIGTIVRFSFMSSSEERNILVYTSQWAMNPRQGIAIADESIQRQLVNILDRAARI